MGRRLRADFPGAIDHVLNPGDRGQDIFPDAADRERFGQPLGEACEQTTETPRTFEWIAHRWRWDPAARGPFAGPAAARVGHGQDEELTTR